MSEINDWVRKLKEEVGDLRYTIVKRRERKKTGDVKEGNIDPDKIKKAKTFAELAESLKGEELKELFNRVMRNESASAEFLQYEYGELIFLKLQELYEIKRGMPAEKAKSNVEIAKEIIYALKEHLNQGEDPYNAFEEILKNKEIFRVNNEGGIEQVKADDLLNGIYALLRYPPKEGNEEAYRAITSFAGIRDILITLIKKPEIFRSAETSNILIKEEKTEKNKESGIFEKVGNGLRLEIKSNLHELQDRIAIIDKKDWKLVAAIDGVSGAGNKGTKAAEAWKKIFENLNINIDISSLSNLKGKEADHIANSILNEIRKTAERLGYKNEVIHAAVFSAVIKFKDKEGNWNVLYLWYGDGGCARYDPKQDKVFVSPLFYDPELVKSPKPLDVIKHDHPLGNVVAHPPLDKAELKHLSEVDYMSIITGSTPIYYLFKAPKESGEPKIIAYTDGLTDAFFGWLEENEHLKHGLKTEGEAEETRLFGIFLNEIIKGNITKDELIKYAMKRADYNDDISIG
ncbi:MAG: hypothetical protein QXI89_01865, partial [Candidatus Anstonellales archaeon]